MDNWKHRSKGMLCLACMWFVAKPTDDDGDAREILGDTIGRCRRRAPTMNGYPVVFGGDWCGDHKLDETK